MKRATLLIVFLFTWVVAMGAQSVSNPVVTGPIPAVVPGDPSHNYPFLSTNVDLASRGYVEEEFFFAGTANIYDLNVNPPQITGASPYLTRMVVRRPLLAEDFNGTVLMEWQNVTNGSDLDALWIESHDHLIRRGYTWIGVSAQRLGVLALLAWSPSRYGALSISSDNLSWDIFSQAAEAVRHPQAVDPMGGLNVERIFAVGWSQGANRLGTYHNSIHSLANIFDAFALVAVDGTLTQLADLDVKVFKVQSETNVAGNAFVKSQAFLHPWEDQLNQDHFRRWEVAGTSQLDYHVANELAFLLERDNLLTPQPNCLLPPLSRVPFYFVINAAYDHMVDWMKYNVAPPIGPDIEVASSDNQISVLARDSFGNALGGIRLSQHAVATATNTGLNTDLDSQSICRRSGSYQRFNQATLDILYPQNGTYVSQVDQVTNENKRIGFIAQEDAQTTIREAAQSDIGRH